MSPRKRKAGRPTTTEPGGYVVQKGRYITVSGVAAAWKPTAAAIEAFDPDTRITPVPSSGMLNPKMKGGLVLSFPTREQAKVAFGKLFGDCALGLADAMPDDSRWINSEMRTTARLMSTAAKK